MTTRDAEHHRRPPGRGRRRSRAAPRRRTAPGRPRRARPARRDRAALGGEAGEAEHEPGDADGQRHPDQRPALGRPRSRCATRCARSGPGRDEPERSVARRGRDQSTTAARPHGDDHDAGDDVDRMPPAQPGYAASASGAAAAPAATNAARRRVVVPAGVGDQAAERSAPPSTSEQGTGERRPADEHQGHPAARRSDRAATVSPTARTAVGHGCRARPGRARGPG